MEKYRSQVKQITQFICHEILLIKLYLVLI